MSCLKLINFIVDFCAIVCYHVIDIWRKLGERCGGIGGRAQEFLLSAGIKLYGGVSGKSDEAVEALLNGMPGYNPNIHCDHHNHEHVGEGHSCGGHGCHK